MKKNSLSSKGLSMSQAQSISNLCNQEATMIAGKLANCNNASKKARFQNQDLMLQRGMPLPEDIISLLQRKAKLHALQAFLMENIRQKEQMLKSLKNDTFKYDVAAPEYPKLKEATYIPLVDENWGWSQLSINEVNEYFEEEAYASHLGQFIHKDGPLDNLRKDLLNLKELEWMSKGTEYCPVIVSAHHTPEGLLNLHNEIASLHRKHEQRVNYYKAKVKNLVSEENTKISEWNANAEMQASSENNLILTHYKNEVFLWESKKRKLSEEFEAIRSSNTRELSAYRISVDPRFQDLVDNFLSQVSE
jgi:hypothetical protein